MEPNKKVTEEMLLSAKQQMMEADKPLKDELEAAKKKYNEAFAEISKPFLALVEQYYDEQLLDSNGNPVAEDRYLTLEKKRFYVKSRGMQVVFGEMLFNPRVIAVLVNEDGISRPKAIEHHLHPSELVNYTLEFKQPI